VNTGASDERHLLSIIIRLPASLPVDALLRQRLSRTVHALALLDAEISSVIRGMAIAHQAQRADQ
jgi:hypothetical protein